MRHRASIWRRWSGAVAVLACMAVVATGCGIPTDAAPRAIGNGDTPSHLLNPTTTTPTTTPVATVPEVVYLVDSTMHLTPVHRDIAPPANLSQILTALLQGPTTAESSAGIQSFVTGNSPTGIAGANHVVATVVNGSATVDFDTNPVQVVGSSLTLLAIAQVVFTATEQPGVNSVWFQIADQPIQVPIAPAGALVPGPVTRANYGPQAPIGSGS